MHASKQAAAGAHGTRGGREDTAMAARPTQMRAGSTPQLTGRAGAPIVFWARGRFGRATTHGRVRDLAGQI